MAGLHMHSPLLPCIRRVAFSPTTCSALVRPHPHVPSLSSFQHQPGLVNILPLLLRMVRLVCHHLPCLLVQHMHSLPTLDEVLKAAVHQQRVYLCMSLLQRFGTRSVMQWTIHQQHWGHKCGRNILHQQHRVPRHWRASLFLLQWRQQQILWAQCVSCLHSSLTASLFGKALHPSMFARGSWLHLAKSSCSSY